MFIADLTGDTAVDGAIYLNSEPLAQEGSASPVEGRNWLSLSVAVVELNNSGDHAFRGRLDGDTTTDYIIVKNGAKLVQEGDVLPDTDGAPLTNLSSSGPVRLNDNGEAVWRGVWVDPKLGTVVGLFKDESLLVQEGVTTEEGFLFESIIAGQDGIALSDNGRYMVFEANLPGGLTGAFLIDFGPACPWDLDGNNDVGVGDLLILLAAWGPNPGHPADFDGDDNVGVSDLLALLANWGPRP